jgi:hypothetical protein
MASIGNSGLSLQVSALYRRKFPPRNRAQTLIIGYSQKPNNKAVKDAALPPPMPTAISSDS